MSNPDRFQQLSTRAKWVLAIVGALVISPIIFLVVKGLVGLAIAGIVGLSIVNLAPVVSMKFANWRLKAIKSEATENPIETMQALLLAKRQAFSTFQKNVVDAVTARSNFETQVTKYSKQYPHRAQEFQTQLSRMTAAVQRKQVALKTAQEQLALAESTVQEMNAYWEMSLALQAANKATGMDTGDMYEKLKADTASDAVMTSINKAFAELEVAAALSYDSDDIDVPAKTVVSGSHPQQKVIENSQPAVLLYDSFINATRKDKVQ